MVIDSIHVYAAVVGGAFAACILYNLRTRVKQSCKFLRKMARQYLVYPHLVRRHRFVGPYSRGAVLLQLCILLVNAFCVGFGASSIQDASRRAARLALLNMIPAYSSAHLSFLADICGISLHSVKSIHRCAGTLALPLLAFHIAASLATRTAFSLRVAENVWGLIAITCLGLQLLLSFPSFRRFSYEVFLQLHQLLAVVTLISVWRHLKLAPKFSRMAPLIAAAVFLAMLAGETVYFIYQNVFTSAGFSRAYITRDGDAIKIRLRLSRPIRVEAGQYIGLYIPTVSFWAPLQIHPFMVTSWSPDRSRDLDIVVQPRNGWTRSLAEIGQKNEQRLLNMIDGGAKVVDEGEIYSKFLVPSLAVFTGPHGCSIAVGEYETVVMIASDFGIASQLPYLDALLYGYNACKTRNRRVHLVWVLEKYSLIRPFIARLNAALDNDSLDEGFILSISIQIAASDRQDEQLGRRVKLYHGAMPLEQILQEEREGRHIRRVQSEVKNCGDVAVLVSATGPIRDSVRTLMAEGFKEGVTLFELDYQVQ